MYELIFILSVVSALAYVLAPLFSRRSLAWLTPEDQTFSFLKERKTTAYTNLRDLDFDHSIGKMSDEDYHRIRTEFKADAAQVISEMEKLDKRIEEEIRSRLAHSCVSCAKPLPKQANFCPHCGQETGGPRRES